MGSDSIALPMLEDLFVNQQRLNIRLAGVFTGMDKPSGRGLKLTANPVKEWTLGKGLPLRQPEKIGSPDLDWLRELGCDLILVMSYGHILKQDLLDFPSLGVFNLHTSILPAYRGPAPIEAAIAAGETETGVSFMGIAPKVDAGPVLDCQPVPINLDDTTAELRGKLSLASVPLLRRCLPALFQGEANFREQDSTQATYTRFIRKSDGCLDFRHSAHQLVDRIRALQPWPGCCFDYNGVRIKIGKAAAGEEPFSGQPGEVINSGGTALDVATGEGILRFLFLQRPGGRMLPVAEFIRGFPFSTGTLLAGGEMLPLSSPNPWVKFKKKK